MGKLTWHIVLLEEQFDKLRLEDDDFPLLHLLFAHLLASPPGMEDGVLRELGSESVDDGPDERLGNLGGLLVQIRQVPQQLQVVLDMGVELEDAELRILRGRDAPYLVNQEILLLSA